MTRNPPAATMPGALIFDYDGLIVDSESVVAAVLLDVLRERGLTANLDMLSDLFGVSPPGNNLLWETLVREQLGSGTDLAALNVEVMDRIEGQLTGLPLLPGVRELADAARAARWRCAIATGKARLSLEPELTRLGIRDRFDVLVTAEDVPQGKPAPDLYLEAARRLEVAADDCVVLEDSLAGCRAGLAAGMRVIVCPCAVTRTCNFPAGLRRVDSLLDVTLESLVTTR